jgi:hypothetical protein
MQYIRRTAKRTANAAGGVSAATDAFDEWVAGVSHVAKQPPRGTVLHTLWMYARTPPAADNGLPVLNEYDDTGDDAHAACSSSTSRRFRPTHADNGDADRRLAYDRLRRAVDTLHAVVRVKPFDQLYHVNTQILTSLFVSLVPVFVGEELHQRYRGVIYARWLGRRELPTRVNFWTARQSGKTTAMAIIMATLLACGHADTSNFISCYSASENQAKLLLAMTREAYHAIPRHLKRDITQSATGHVAVRFSRTGDGRDEHGQRTDPDCDGVAEDDITDDEPRLRCSVHTSSINTNRGDNALIWIIDEFCFNDPGMYKQHYTVAMQFAGRRWVLCITTPGDPRDEMTRIFQSWIDDTEAKSHLTMDLGLVCAEHKRANTPLECRCRLHYAPPWVNVPDKMAEIANAGADAEKVQTELLGIAMSATRTVFPPGLLDLFSQTRFELRADTPIDNDILYVCVDPAAGAERSQFAAISFIVSCGMRIITGIESMRAGATNVLDWCHVLTEHVLSLLMTDPFRDRVRRMRVVPVLEMNMDASCTNQAFDELKAECARRLGVSVLHVYERVLSNASYTPNARGGVRTTAEVKRGGAAQFRALMYHSTVMLRFAVHVFTTGITRIDDQRCPVRTNNRREHADVPSEAEAACKTKLYEQLGRLAEDERKGICGKDGVNPDDLAITMLFGLFYIQLVSHAFAAGVFSGCD